MTQPKEQTKEKSIWKEDQVVKLTELRMATLGNTPGSNDDDEPAIDDAISAVLHAVKNDNQENRPVLLHIGVGVGDPKSTLSDLNNPSGDKLIDNKVRANQVNPAYLMSDAVTSGYFVVALNFNEADGVHVVKPLQSERHGVRRQVIARFPLAPCERLTKLVGLLKLPNLQRVVICNSISQEHYTGILEFAKTAWHELRKHSFPVSYVHYAYNTCHTTYALLGKTMALSANEDTLLRLDSVFPISMS